MASPEAVALFGPDQVARARAYHRPLYAAALARQALQLAVLALIAFAAPGRWLFDPVSGLPWWAQVVCYTALIEGLELAIALPFAIWGGFVRERRYGFSTQRPSGFAADRAKAFAVGLVVSCGCFAFLVGSARALPRLWPVAAAGAAALLLAVLTFVAPLVVEPLFNRFTPLADPELAAELDALARRAGLPLREVLVADASRRTRKANAYVSGLGATRRLVVYDTLLERATRPEVALVLAHELGHRRGRHLLKGVGAGMASAAAFIVILWTLLRSSGLQASLSAPGGAGDPRVVAFVFLLATVLESLTSPLAAALSRRFEREADRFSLALTDDLSAFESTHRSLAAANLADLDPPRPIYVAFFTHPTPVERIGAARRQAGASGPV
jgi:STE24 endopeptidase